MLVLRLASVGTYEDAQPHSNRQSVSAGVRIRGQSATGRVT